ncbi:hypothetical protein GPL15_02795 [Clostridium sp. MCC353]|uniref:DUF4829 domain-containing protein n=1 Tax=Clostridium sp. MCC353 TaxID=2592646 RepID=UPI001C0322EF|nr:DUF4829 domain-containing protein [Clostridium sp. MCC353]MBT9775435.1 hypothetical protein [Clostridium sp. MCC353]
MKKIGAAALSLLLAAQLNACSAVISGETPAASAAAPTTVNNVDLPSPSSDPAAQEVQPDTLQKLYIDYPQTAGYREAVAFIRESELPYSEKKLNGSRIIKIALEESGTDISLPAVDTFRDYDYILVDYLYPKQENNRTDNLDSYIFAGISYITSNGNFLLESHAENVFITKDGELLDFDTSSTRQEQMSFYLNLINADSSNTHSEPVSQDIKACIDAKMASFEEECTLTDLWYDKEKSEALADSYMKYGRGASNGATRENVIVILSTLKTGANTWSFEPNAVYTDWKWILIRDNPHSNWVVDDYGN